MLHVLQNREVDSVAQILTMIMGLTVTRAAKSDNRMGNGPFTCSFLCWLLDVVQVLAAVIVGNNVLIIVFSHCYTIYDLFIRESEW